MNVPLTVIDVEDSAVTMYSLLPTRLQETTHTHTPFHPLSWTACHLNHDLILWLWHQRWHHHLTGSGPRSVGSRETLLMCTGTFSRGSSCDGTGQNGNTGSTFQCKHRCNQSIHRKSKTKTYYNHIPWCSTMSCLTHVVVLVLWFMKKGRLFGALRTSQPAGIRPVCSGEWASVCCGDTSGESRGGA